MELLLIRHAATDMAGTLCGHSDPPLNAIGREQASALASLVNGLNLRRLYTSDLQRAVETAQPLAHLWNIPIVTRSDLREISFGQWEGRRWSEVTANGTDIRAMESLPELCAPGGETFSCFRERVRRALKEAVADSGGHSIAIVTHLGVMRVILSDLNSTSRAWNPHERIEPCSVYRILVNGCCLEFDGELTHPESRQS
jgi:broad specificity phosphatase PhoE